MNPLEQFLELARRDAAVQERLAAAVRTDCPISAVRTLASDVGFSLSDEQAARLAGEGELNDAQLDSVAGGARISSPQEMFAEFSSTTRPGKIERD